MSLQTPVTARGRAGRLRHAHGFTTVELLIAVVIVGVLSALAFPSFMDAMRKGRRAEAFGKLNAVQLAQERWRSNNALYNDQLAALPTASAPGLGIPVTTADGRYELSLSGTPTATRYVVVASGIAGTSQHADGNCAQLAVRIDNANIEYGSAPIGQSLDFAAGNRCWAR